MSKAGKEIGEQEDPQPQVNLHARTVGTYFTTGQMIIMILSLEDVHMRAEVLADVCKAMKITPEQIKDEYYDEACSKCGMSLLMHRDEPGGQCP